MTVQKGQGNQSRRRRGPKAVRTNYDDLEIFAMVLAVWREAGGTKAIKVDGNPFPGVCDTVSELLKQKTDGTVCYSPQYIYNIYKRVARVQGEEGETILDIFLSDGELPPGPAASKQKRDDAQSSLRRYHGLRSDDPKRTKPIWK